MHFAMKAKNKYMPFGSVPYHITLLPVLMCLEYINKARDLRSGIFFCDGKMFKIDSTAVFYI